MHFCKSENCNFLHFNKRLQINNIVVPSVGEGLSELDIYIFTFAIVGHLVNLKFSPHFISNLKIKETLTKS